LEGELNFVYMHFGAAERVMDNYERSLATGYVSGHASAVLWSSSYAPVRKTERFKAYVRKAGLVEYWRAKGWPDVCRPIGTDDFECT
jgi:hypothetical protein